jgi:hypothetical protein
LWGKSGRGSKRSLGFARDDNEESVASDTFGGASEGALKREALFPSCHPERSRGTSYCLWLGVLALIAATATATAADAPAQADKAATNPNSATRESAVPISFLPPPLENAAYSLGIYEAKSGKLVRRLQESAPESAFTAGLNGLITSWDRKNDAGEIVPPGKYAARGYAVGPLKVEGVAFHGNDWVEQDENLRVKHVESIIFVPADNGLVVLSRMANDSLELMRFSGEKENKLLWRKPLPDTPTDEQPWLRLEAETIAVFPRLPSSSGADDEVNSSGVYQVSDGSEIEDRSFSMTEERMPLPASLGTMPKQAALSASELSPTLREIDTTIRAGVGNNAISYPRKERRPIQALNAYTARSSGKDGSVWVAGGYEGLMQQTAEGKPLRGMGVQLGEPAPRAVSASTSENQLYLLEEKPGWQRVRGLSWMETKDEGSKQISTWETFFERNIRAPDPALGLEDPTTAKAPSPVVEMTLAENELSPGKPAKAKLTAGFDDKGSYLTAADGLRLRKIGERANLRAVKLARAKALGSLSFFQTDGAAWDEFSIAGADKIMSFDAGEFELTATGEKPAESKPPEPDL